MPIRSPVGEAGPAGADAQAGYVLIEVVATMVITLMLLAFAFPSLPSATTPTKLRALVTRSVALLRDARSSAILTAQAVPALFDAKNRSLRFGTAVVIMPPDVAISLDAGGNCPAARGSAEILFRPDGTNCGGILRFAKGTTVLRARIRWIDGRIDVVQGD